MAEIELPPGYGRVAADDDVMEEAAEHIRDAFLAQSGRPLLSVEDYANFWSSQLIDRPADLVLVRGEGGGLAAQAVVINRPPFVDPTAYAAVSTDHMGRGLGTALLRWEVARAVERIAEAPPGARVAMQVFCDAGHAPSTDLLEANGFAADRYFLNMAITFADPPPAPDIPAGIDLRTFSTGEAEAAVRAVRDAFRDHYGHVERPFEEHLAQILHMMEHPDFDPSLWWHLYEGDEIVANCWNLNNHNGDRATGYVLSLGVRPPWRGRGLGRALLLQAFEEFHSRGLTGAALDVDAQSLTGATRLYESVGMSAHHRNAMYVKELRAGEDLATRALS